MDFNRSLRILADPEGPERYEEFAMTSRIADYWSSLADAVHPDDKLVFSRFAEHGFNLDFPPPAFIGDVVNARVVILDNNGGFDQRGTVAEFRDQAAKQAYRDRLARPCVFDPNAPGASPYYDALNFSAWLRNGTAALVNGVAYRSTDTKAQNVKRLSRVLPSAELHRNWLMHDLRRQVDAGERFVIVHRWGCWHEATGWLRGHPCAVFSPLPNGPRGKNLSPFEITAAARFLHGRPDRLA